MSRPGYVSPTNTLNFVPCSIDELKQAGAKEMQLKGCENCPCWFSREVGSTQKYCAECVSRMLLPPEDRYMDEIREMSAQSPEGRAQSHRIRYDDSLQPLSERKLRRQARIAAILQLFTDNETVTSRQIMNVAGWHVTGGGSIAYCLSLGIKIKNVGCGGKPRDWDGKRGYALYILEEVIQ